MDSHCVYQKEATYLLMDEQIHFLSGHAFSLCALNYAVKIANPPWRENKWLLKGMGDETMIGLLRVMPQNTHMTH